MNTLRFIEWKDSYLTGVPECDADHQRIIGIVNELYVAMTQGREAGVLDSVFGELRRYTEEHFAREDHYLEGLPSPEAQVHRQSHAEMASWTRGISVGRTHGQEDTSRDVLDRLKRWWTSHILVADRAYAMVQNSTTTRGPGDTE